MNKREKSRNDSAKILGVCILGGFIILILAKLFS